MHGWQFPCYSSRAPWLIRGLLQVARWQTMLEPRLASGVTCQTGVLGAPTKESHAPPWLVIRPPGARDDPSAVVRRRWLVGPGRFTTERRQPVVGALASSQCLGSISWPAATGVPCGGLETGRRCKIRKKLGRGPRGDERPFGTEVRP
jgi:hypothetical protein